MEWQVRQLNEDGFFRGEYIGVFKAKTADKAREIAAKHCNNNSITTTGFYDAVPLTAAKRKEILLEIANLRRGLESLN